MELVFFDIECACVYKNIAKICAFGYVRTDEKFNIIEKEDILINPKGNFHLTDRSNNKGIVLPYEYNNFTCYPTFPEVYPKIKALLENKNAIVFGHSALNDVNYLNLEVKRYNLDAFNFKFYDTQIMYMDAIKDFSRQYGLESINAELSIDFVAHKAVEDAYVTMRVAQELCKRESVTITDFFVRHELIAGSLADNKITSPLSKDYQEFLQERARQREERSRRRTHFVRYIQRTRKLQQGILTGKVFNFSKALEEESDEIKSILRGIFSLGGMYSLKLDDCNVFVSAPDDASVRFCIAKSREEQGTLQVMSVEELKKLLGID